MNTMDTQERRSFIARLVQSMRVNGSWAGETHIQKCMLFLQELMKVPAGYEFVLYHHGPFSFDLRKELANLSAGLVLDLESHERYGPSFMLGHWGNQAAQDSDAYQDEIAFIADRVSGFDTRMLERISTGFFIQTKYTEMSDGEVADRVCELKPHITRDQMMAAMSTVSELRKAAQEIVSSTRPVG